MLKITKKSEFKFNSIISINKNGGYDDHIKKKYLQSEDILVCPTDAINLDEIKIDSKKCVECLLCPYFFPSGMIEYSEEDSFRIFLEFVNLDNTYLTKWIGQALISSNTEIRCGFEVKIDGGSRSKRIPLLIIIDNRPIILKIVDSFKDIEYGILSLDEIENIIIQNNLQIPKKIIVVNEIKTKFDEVLQKPVDILKEKHNFKMIFIETIWESLKNGMSEKSVEWKKIFLPETS